LNERIKKSINANMPKWDAFPPEIRHQILGEFCNSISLEFKRYPSTIKNRSSNSVIWDAKYPRPLSAYLNALLTCREFNDVIAKHIKLTNHQPTADYLQELQYRKLEKYSQELFMLRVPYHEILMARAMFGCFWKNRYVIDEFEMFDDMYDGLDKTGRLILVSLLGPTLEKCKPRFSRSHSGGELVKVLKRGKGSSRCGLVFTTGSDYVGGGCVNFHTVLGYKFVMIKENERGKYDSDEEDEFEFEELSKDDLLRADLMKGTLPDITTSEPGTWWLGRDTDGEEWNKEWYLVNYTEKNLVVGPMGYSLEWPEEFGFSLGSLHLWQPSFYEGSDFEGEDNSD
jgi:hypothetical protein